jgi:hypothetical protein
MKYIKIFESENYQFEYVLVDSKRIVSEPTVPKKCGRYFDKLVSQGEKGLFII